MIHQSPLLGRLPLGSARHDLRDDLPFRVTPLLEVHSSFPVVPSSDQLRVSLRHHLVSGINNFLPGKDSRRLDEDSGTPRGRGSGWKGNTRV